MSKHGVISLIFGRNKQQHNRFNGSLSRSTQVSWYQKKHNIFNFLHFLRSLHICQGICFYNLTPSFLWPASGSYTFHFKIHARIFSTNITLKYYLDSIETWWYNVCFWLVFSHSEWFKCG